MLTDKLTGIEITAEEFSQFNTCTRLIQGTENKLRLYEYVSSKQAYPKMYFTLLINYIILYGKLEHLHI